MKGKRIGWFLLALLLGLLLSACGAQDEAAVQACAEAQGSLDSFLEAYAQGDAQTAAQLLSGSGENGQSEEPSALQTALAQKLTMEVQSSEKQGDIVTIKAKIRNVDIASVFKALPEGLESQQEATDALLAALSDEKCPMKDYKVEVEMIPSSDGQWRLTLTPELSDALLGGFSSYLQTLEKEAIK